MSESAEPVSKKPEDKAAPPAAPPAPSGDPPKSASTGASDAPKSPSGSKASSRYASEARFERKIQGIQTNIGPANFNFGVEAVKPLWERMAPVETLGGYPPFAVIEEVQRFGTILHERRLLVVEQRSTDDDALWSATFSVLEDLRRRHADLQLRTISDSEDAPRFSAQLFIDLKSRPADSRPTLVYWDCRREWHRVQEVYGRKDIVGSIRTRLRDLDCRLLLITRPPPVLAKDAPPSEDVWRIGILPELRAEVPGWPDRGPEELRLGLLAALFPRLGAEEFLRLADALLGALPPPPAEGEPARKPGPADAPPAKPSTLERWRRGDRDRILAELGVSYHVQRGSTPQGGAASGFTFETPEATRELAAWLLQRRPVLLRECLPALTAHYFSDLSTSRYADGFRDLLLQLHRTGAHRVDPAWLRGSWAGILDSEDPMRRIESLAELLELFNDPDDAAMIDSFAEFLAGEVAQAEESCLRALDEKELGAPLAEGERGMQAAVGAVAGGVQAAGLLPMFESAHRRIYLALAMLARLAATVRLRSVSAALEALVARRPDASWARSLPDGAAVSPFAAPLLYALRLLMMWAAEELPLLWARFAAAILDCTQRVLDGSGAKRPGGQSETHEIRRKRLTQFVVISLTAYHEAFWEGERASPAPGELTHLFRGGEARRTGEVVGGLLLSNVRLSLEGADERRAIAEVEAVDIVELYGTTARALALCEGLDAAELGTMLDDFCGPLARKLGAVRRDEVRQWIRYRREQVDEQRRQPEARLERDEMRRLASKMRALSLLVQAFRAGPAAGGAGEPPTT